MSEKYYAETERSKVWWNIVSFNFCYLNVGKKNMAQRKRAWAHNLYEQIPFA